MLGTNTCRNTHLNLYISASIRQKEEIQELRGRRDEPFQRIRHQFTFIYRAEGQVIYDQYEKAKQAVNRNIKAWERELMKQIQKEYDVVAPVQDIRAQLEGDAESLSIILFISGRVRYAFMERSRIAKAFFNSPSTRGAEGDVHWRVFIVDDMMSLCSGERKRSLWWRRKSPGRGPEVGRGHALTPGTF